MISRTESRSARYGEMNAVSGKLAGKAMPFLGEPKRMRLAEWREKHPDSLVLVGRHVAGLPPGALPLP